MPPHRPDELADVEARLATLGALPCRIDRDELLYRAGFAAAQARGAESTRWRGPVVSAAAAAIAVAATHMLWPAAVAVDDQLAELSKDEDLSRYIL